MCTAKVYYSLDDETEERRADKENAEDDRCLKQEQLRSATFVKRSTEVIATERAAKARTALLKQDCCYKKGGEGDLHVRKNSTEKFHYRTL